MQSESSYDLQVCTLQEDALRQAGSDAQWIARQCANDYCQSIQLATVSGNTCKMDAGMKPCTNSQEKWTTENLVGRDHHKLQQADEAMGRVPSRTVLIRKHGH